MRRPAPDPAVVDWAASQPLETLLTTSVTQAEILYGIALLRAGRRRLQLEEAVSALFDQDFKGRILPFDGEAAAAYAEIAAKRKRSGHPISQFDAQIAATTRSRCGRLATRRIHDFDDCGLKIINPWSR